MIAVLMPLATGAEAADWAGTSMRPLPTASNRAMAEGPAYVVDAAKGDDAAPGSVQKPWKTLAHAIGKLKPGDTLYLRGTFFEPTVLRLTGTADKPITLRSAPGQLAIIDGGYREFFEDPANAWEPFAGGAEGEYVSKKTYAEDTGNFGNFGGSMVPFQRYMFLSDLRSTNEYFRQELGNRANDPAGVYAGPGTIRNPDTGKIHIRLAHTKLEGLGASAYTGETDPRKLPLVIAGTAQALTIEASSHLRLQDIIVRGGARVAVRIENAKQIDLDGVTLYGSGAAIRCNAVEGMRIVNSALRGHAAPWHSRFHHKDRAGSGYLLAVAAPASDFEIANCEMTDHHDGLWIQPVNGIKIHHNFIDNFNDDGIESGPKKAAGRTEIYCNFVSRCFNPFTAHGKQPDPVESEAGSGVYLYRNIFDLRPGIYAQPPTEADPSGAYLNRNINDTLHDHGSPAQQIFYVYHNTFIAARTAWRDMYGLTWTGRTVHTTRRVFNNIFFQVEGMPGMNFSPTALADDVQADGNLHWSVKEGPAFKGDAFAKFRESKAFAESKAKYPAGWTANDLFVDPNFAGFKQEYLEPSDLRLAEGSPAINAGQPLPAEWPDPLRAADADKPDIGALPAGSQPWTIGVNGRLSAFGHPIAK